MDAVTTTPPPRKQRALSAEQIDRTKPASLIVAKFGGLMRFCNLTGYKTSTVHGWVVRGFIPAHRGGVSHHAHIMKIAAANKIELTATDFLDL